LRRGVREKDLEEACSWNREPGMKPTTTHEYFGGGKKRNVCDGSIRVWNPRGWRMEETQEENLKGAIF